MLELHRGDSTGARTLLVNGLRIDAGQRMWRTMLGRIAPATGHAATGT